MIRNYIAKYHDGGEIHFVVQGNDTLFVDYLETGLVAKVVNEGSVTVFAASKLKFLYEDL